MHELSLSSRGELGTEFEGFRRTAIERAAELKTRVFFCLVCMAVIGGTVSIAYALGWGVLVAITQFVDYRANSVLRDENRTKVLSAFERVSILSATALATAVYGLAAPIIWFGMEPFGQTFAAFLVCGMLLHTVIHMHYVRALFLASFIPHTTTFFATPVAEILLNSNNIAPAAWGLFLPMVLYIGHLLKAYSRNKQAFWTVFEERETAFRERAAAEAANQAKDSFLAMMSHELRTPLNGVLGAAQALDRTELSSDQKQLTQILSSSGSVLLTVINDILDFSKIEAGKLELESQPVALSNLVQDIKGLWGPVAQRKDIALQVTSSEPNNFAIHTDATRLRQILFNIVSNAIKFTGEGEVSVSVQYADGVARFVIEDSGCGVPEDRIESLFEPFVQADATTTRKYGGTGLGLSISRRLARMMGGDIFYEPAAARGSRFIIEIPTVASEIKHHANPNPAKDKKDAVHSSAPVRALLTEDNDVNRRIVEVLLSGEDVSLTMAENGSEALDLLARERFDIVLMDIQMPVMDGVTAVRELRSRSGPNKATPVIALTANVMKDQKAAYLEAGMTDVLAKPIRRDDLIEMMLHYSQNGATSDEVGRAAS